jgi:two-component system, LytTR family, response regulator
MTIRTLLVDDEGIARRGLRRQLQRAPDFDIVGECADGIEAQRAISDLKPDLVFLDIRMPELSGIDLVKLLPKTAPPRIVFVTAYDEYAVRAFEVHALDYLLKPVAEDRFTATLVRIRQSLSEGPTEGYARKLAAVLAQLGHGPSNMEQQGSDRIAVPHGDRMAILRVADVDWVEASGNYVTLHAREKTWLLRETIAAMDARLAPSGFVRIHRSTLVNIERVTELRSLDNGEFAVSLSAGTVLKLSRSYRDALDSIVGRRSPSTAK